MKEIKVGPKSEMKASGPAFQGFLSSPGHDADILLTVQEVAELLKVPISWVYEHTRAGCRDPLPYVKMGKYLRFFATDILNYLDAMRSRDHRGR